MLKLQDILAHQGLDTSKATEMLSKLPSSFTVNEVIELYNKLA